MVVHRSPRGPEGRRLGALERCPRGGRSILPLGNVSCCHQIREEGTPSMDSSTATSGTTHPDAIEFVRFCYRRRRVGWPELYDEMCAVAGRGLFRGFDADDLGGIGIGFSLFDMPALAVLSTRIIAEEHALRRPVAVMITAEVALAPAPEMALEIAAIHASVPASPMPTPYPARESREERTFEVPVRLTMVPSGA